MQCGGPKCGWGDETVGRSAWRCERAVARGKNFKDLSPRSLDSCSVEALSFAVLTCRPATSISETSRVCPKTPASAVYPAAQEGFVLSCGIFHIDGQF